MPLPPLEAVSTWLSWAAVAALLIAAAVMAWRGLHTHSHHRGARGRAERRRAVRLKLGAVVFATLAVALLHTLVFTL